MRRLVNIAHLKNSEWEIRSGRASDPVDRHAEACDGGRPYVSRCGV